MKRNLFGSSLQNTHEIEKSVVNIQTETNEGIRKPKVVDGTRLVDETAKARFPNNNGVPKLVISKQIASTDANTPLSRMTQTTPAWRRSRSSQPQTTQTNSSFKELPGWATELQSPCAAQFKAVRAAPSLVAVLC